MDIVHQLIPNVNVTPLASATVTENTVFIVNLWLTYTNINFIIGMYLLLTTSTIPFLVDNWSSINEVFDDVENLKF